MQQALSLKFGETIITATEANYSSYLDLGLLCICCREPVFLVNSRKHGIGKRRLKSGKTIEIGEYETDPYFVHFNAKQTECQLASKTYNSSFNFSQVNSINRQQRIKKFELKLEGILKSTFRCGNNLLLQSLWQRNFTKSNSFKKINHILRIESAQMREHIDFFKNQILSVGATLLWADDVPDYLNYQKSAVEINLHLRTAVDVAEFLVTPSGYKIFSSIYQVAVMEAVVIEAILAFLLKNYGSDSSIYNHALIYHRYIAFADGIFGFVKANLIDRPNLENLINVPYPLNPQPELICCCLAGMIFSVPWKTAFDDNLDKRDDKVLNPAYIQAFHVGSLSRNGLGCFLLDRVKSKLLSRKKYNSTAKEVNLDLWLDKKLENIKFNKSKMLLGFGLPSPISNLGVLIEVPKRNFINDIARFELVEQGTNKLIVQIWFWLWLDERKFYKKLLKQNASFKKHEIKNLCNSPSALILSKSSSQYDFLTLSIINTLFLRFQDLDLF